MSLTSSIVRQFVVSSVLLSVLPHCSAVRFTRSMGHSAPSMRKYIHPWKYVPYSELPRSMQRRFMWADGTGGVASGARGMTHMFSPSMVRYRKPIDYDTQPSTKIKYVIKKPPPPFKRMKVVKMRAPKKTIPMYSLPLVDIPSVGPTFPPSKPNLIMPFMSEEELRKIEKEQEKRVESVNYSDFHQHTHQTHVDDDLIGGRINEFGEGWLPIKGSYSTPKPFIVSQLHTKVEITTIPPPLIHSEAQDNQSYEVTEHSAEESIQREEAFKPSNHLEFLGPTTEVPNYPEYFLKNIQKSEEQFKPIRVKPPATTIATTTTSTSTTLSHRLPPRSTTERPFQRYNLHRPKSSKLFFKRPTSTPDSLKQTQTTTTTGQSIIVIPEVLPIMQEPIRTTLESIKTIREPIRTTRLPPKAPPEKVRTTRNNSEIKTQIKIKNSSQSESLNKTPIKHRGGVKFGEKQK